VSKATEKKSCLACSSPIPIGAIKCVDCGTYQTWRRHLDFGNTTLALVVAALGIATTIPSTIIGVSSALQGAYEPEYVSRILKIDHETASVFVKNNLTNEILISKMDCSLWFPINGVDGVHRYHAWHRRADVSSGHSQFLDGSPVLEYWVDYNTEPTVLEPGGYSVIEMNIGGVAYSIVSLAEIQKRSAEARSNCILEVGLDEKSPSSISVAPESLFFVYFNLPAFISKYHNNDPGDARAILDSLVGYE
jgi:hypothetical protein